MMSLNKSERDDLKERASRGDKAAAERLRAVREYDAAKSRAYLERKRTTKATVRDQVDNRQRSTPVVYQAISTGRGRDKSSSMDSTSTSTSTTESAAVKKELAASNMSVPTSKIKTDTLGGHASTPTVKVIDLVSSDDETHGGSQVAARRSHPKPVTSPSTGSAKKSAEKVEVKLQPDKETTKHDLSGTRKMASEADIKLQLDKVARKKAKTEMNRKLLQMEKELMKYEDEETDLKLELLRVQRARLEEECE